MPRKPRTSELAPPLWYEKQLARQGGGCAICGSRPKKRRLHIDHDHGTGAIRGLLCYGCNARLLVRGTTPNLLRDSADYLEGGGAPTMPSRATVAQWTALRSVAGGGNDTASAAARGGFPSGAEAGRGGKALAPADARDAAAARDNAA